MHMKPLTMPANFAAMDEEEMTYATGGCFISGIIAENIGNWLLAHGATRNLGNVRAIPIYEYDISSPVTGGKVYSYNGHSYYDPYCSDDSYVYYDGDRYWAGSTSSWYYKIGAPLKKYGDPIYSIYTLYKIFKL